MSYPEVGTGTTILFQTSAFQAQVDVRSLRFKGGARAVIETTKLAQAVAVANQLNDRTFKPSKLKEGARITVGISYDVRPGKQPPLHADPETIRVTWPDGSYLEGEGFIYDMDEVAAGHENILETAIHIQCSGLWRVLA